MNDYKVSGGYVRIAQVGILVFFVPLLSFLSYGIIINNFSINGLSFLFVFISVTSLVLWHVFSYSDVYVSNDLIVAKKLFTTKCKKRSEVKQVTKAIRPFTYRVKFIDGEKIIFMSTVSDTFKQLLSLDPDATLKVIRKSM